MEAQYALLRIDTHGSNTLAVRPCENLQSPNMIDIHSLEQCGDPKLSGNILNIKHPCSKSIITPKILQYFLQQSVGEAWRTGSRQLPINPSLAEWSGPTLSSKACIHNQCSIYKFKSYYKYVASYRELQHGPKIWGTMASYLPSLRVPAGEIQYLTHIVLPLVPGSK